VLLETPVGCVVCARRVEKSKKKKKKKADSYSACVAK